VRILFAISAKKFTAKSLFHDDAGATVARGVLDGLADAKDIGQLTPDGVVVAFTEAND